ncbi:DUF5610 domain-containing protein [Methylophaga sp. OBS4]|uniref:DUF5610 domain-containing protein n=1 Tax=Methylophaga sp. OBS4 TaxID=2991935 RepID=UPI00225234B8|nr:DUF5610 domain-containing protein [Methylophaga sp. OBS4]MCX4188008.1 DUF5610 domain-containing protein [Methylophaga sp. OBS4]
MSVSFQPFGQTVSSLAKDPANKSDGPFGQTISAMAHEKKSTTSEFNKSILDVSLRLSESRGDGALSLLYKTALEGINEQLQSEFGSDAIQGAFFQDTDVSPDATAERIVQAGTGFFNSYYASHQDLTLEEALTSFAQVISNGIDQGFSEAREILNNLQVLKGTVATNIDHTYDLVQQGLQAFVKNYSTNQQA